MSKEEEEEEEEEECSRLLPQAGAAEDARQDRPDYRPSQAKSNECVNGWKVFIIVNHILVWIAYILSILALAHMTTAPPPAQQWTPVFDVKGVRAHSSDNVLGGCLLDAQLAVSKTIETGRLSIKVYACAIPNTTFTNARGIWRLIAGCSMPRAQTFAINAPLTADGRGGGGGGAEGSPSWWLLRTDGTVITLELDQRLLSPGLNETVFSAYRGQLTPPIEYTGYFQWEGCRDMLVPLT